MTIPARPPSELRTLIRSEIQRQDPDIDVTTGVIPATAIYAQAAVNAAVHEDVRQVSLYLSLTDPTVFAGANISVLEGILANEGMSLLTGGRSATPVVFSRPTAPVADYPVPRGTPIGSATSAATGASVVYVTTEARTMYAASAASYFNPVTGRYELSVPARAVASGSSSVVAPNRLTRQLQSLTGFDRVTNPSASSAVKDQETAARAIERFLLAVAGRAPSSPLGLERVALQEAAAILDLAVVWGNDPLLTRASSEAGAVDVYVRGGDIIEASDSVPYLGLGQVMPLSTAPVVQVLSVQDLASGTTYVEGVDFEVVRDAGGNNLSARAVDGVRFLAGGASPAATAQPLLVTYQYDNLVRALQARFQEEDLATFGQDVLWKRATEVPIALEGTIRTVGLVGVTTVISAARTAVFDFINSQVRNGVDVEASDINAVVRGLTGIDNFVITRLSRVSESSGVGDVAVAKNEFASIAYTDLLLSPR